MINTDDFGDFTQTLCCAFLEESYGIRFAAGDSYRKTQEIEFIEEVFGKYLHPQKNICGPRIVIAEKALTMPDLFMFQPIKNDIDFFNDKNYFWVESKSATEPRTLVSIKKNLYFDYSKFNETCGYNVFVSFIIPIKKYREDNDEYWLWDYDFYLQTIDSLNTSWFDKEEYPNMVWWRLKNDFRKLNRFAINMMDYRNYFN